MYIVTLYIVYCTVVHGLNNLIFSANLGSEFVPYLCFEIVQGY